MTQAAEQYLFSHADVADRDTQAQHLLQLELDRGLDVLNLQVRAMRPISHNGVVLHSDAMRQTRISLCRCQATPASAAMPCNLDVCSQVQGPSPHLALQVVVLADEGGELAGLVEAGAQKTRDHLDDRVRRQEGGVLLGCTENQDELVRHHVRQGV